MISIHGFHPRGSRWGQSRILFLVPFSEDVADSASLGGARPHRSRRRHRRPGRGRAEADDRSGGEDVGDADAVVRLWTSNRRWRSTRAVPRSGQGEGSAGGDVVLGDHEPQSLWVGRWWRREPGDRTGFSRTSNYMVRAPRNHPVGHGQDHARSGAFRTLEGNDEIMSLPIARGLTGVA